MKNVVILGDSDLASTKSLQKGLELKNNLKVFNLSIGATTSSHKIIELKLKRNKEIIDKADLIIYHSNANDSRYFISPKIAYREINWAFKELYFCSKKVLICILPSYYSQYTAIIENIQRQLASLYGFSVIDWSIDMNESYIIKFLLRDNLHFFDFVLRNIGVSISENIDKFLPSKYLNINNDNPQFVTCLMNEVKLDRNCETREIEWLGQICYNVYILKKDNKLKFPKKYYGYNLIAIETHNLNWAAMSSLVIKDDDRNTVFLARPILNVKSLNNPIKINKNLTMQYNYTNNLENVDKVYPWSMPEGQKSLGYIGLIGFLLASPEGNYYTEEIDFEALANENIKIPEEYDFN
ncbi:SGNH/GDSL hydrolase family protein, partial [Campylobacter jejuni]|uniref:SGNH/GDSL hydrolase family protein n=1 Tax=Campylobacter jejuni TaxID=197 RepID=UPI003B9F0108